MPACLLGQGEGCDGGLEGRLTHHKLCCVMNDTVGGLGEVYITFIILKHTLNSVIDHLRLRVLCDLLV